MDHRDGSDPQANGSGRRSEAPEALRPTAGPAGTPSVVPASSSSKDPTAGPAGPTGAACAFEGCQWPVVPDQARCLLHLSAQVKQELGLWQLARDRFLALLDQGEGAFPGLILQDLDLAGRTIHHDLDLSRARFLGHTVLSLSQQHRCEFAGEVDLTGAVFEGPVDLAGATFARRVNFHQVRFQAPVSMTRARFLAELFITSCQFKSKVDLIEVLFRDHASFARTRFHDEVLLTRAYFEKGGTFDDCWMTRGSFEDASIQYVSFRKVNLDQVRFAGAMMENAYLADSLWTAEPDRTRWEHLQDELSVADPRFVVREELEARRLPDDPPPAKVQALHKAESTYRRLKHTHTNEGDYTKAGEFYIHEMRMKQARYRLQPGLRARWKLVWNHFYNLSCGYGERPKRVILNALLVMFCFGLVYHAGEGIEKDGDQDYDPSLQESFYFSVVTFTTLGYGDYAPKPTTQLLATLEAFTGAFTMALFVLVFARKVMR